MKFRQTPGGTWCGTEKDYRTALKSEGIDPKKYTGREFVEVPTDKAGLMEFLTFHGVNVINPRTLLEVPTTSAVAAQIVGAPIPDLDELFEAAPVETQLKLAISALNNAHAQANQELKKV